MPSSDHKKCRDRSPPSGYRRLHPSGRNSPYSFQRTPPSNKNSDELDEDDENKCFSGRRLKNAVIARSTFAMASRCLYERLRKRMEVLGARHPGTLEAMVFLSQAYYRQLRYRDAEKLGVQVLDFTRDIFGEQNIGTIELMADLARVRWRLGQFKEAEGLEVQIVQLRKEVEGEREPRTIRAMMDLGETWRRLNRHEEAAEMFKKVLSLETLDTEEAEEGRWLTLQATERLGWTYQQLGRVGDAVPYQTQAHRMIDDTLLGRFPDPGPTSAEAHSVPLLYHWYKQARYPVAEPYSLDKLHKPVVEKHPDMLWLRASLSWEAWVWQGRYKEAEELLQQAIEPQQRTFGEEHPDTLKFKTYLAKTWRKQGRQVEAEALQARILELQKKVLGPEHPDSMLSMAKLADNWHEQGRFAEAAALQSKALELYRKRVGDNHYDTLRSINSLARAYHALGWLDEAEKMYSRVLEIRMKTLVGCPPQIINSKERLAIVWHDQGRTKDAVEMLSNAIDGAGPVLDAYHQSTIRMKDTLAAWLNESKNEALVVV